MWIRSIFSIMNQRLTAWLSQGSFSVMSLLYVIFELAFFKSHYATYDSYFYSLFVTLSLILGLIFSELRNRPWYWMALTVSHGYWVYYSRYVYCNNHDFLDGYILMVLTVACFVNSGQRLSVLSRNAALVVAMLFCFATLHKWLSPDFFSGKFLLFQMHIDLRFLPACFLFSEQANEIIAANRNLLFKLNYFGPEPTTIRFFQEGLLMWTSLFSKIIFFWELSIGILFLFQFNRFFTVLKHSLLISFCAVTYMALPIVNFGLMISLLGMASLSEEYLTLKKCYFFLMMWMVVIYYLSRYIDFLFVHSPFIVLS